MTFEIRRYIGTVEDCNVITLFQILPCLNIGWMFDIIRREEKFNIAFGWAYWIFEWSFKFNKKR